MSLKLNEALYRFHKELSRPFSGAQELIAAGLRLIASQISVDRVTSFVLEPKEMMLVSELSLSGGVQQETDEEIHVLASSPLAQLLDGRKAVLTYGSPYPMACVALPRAGSAAFPAAPTAQPRPAREKTLRDGPRRKYAPGSMREAALPADGPVFKRGLLRFERKNGRKPRAFTPSEQKFAGQLALELARRLEQVEISDRSQQQLKRTQALTELTALFASSLRVEDGLKLILQGIQRHFALDRVRLYLVNRNTRTLRGELSVDMRGLVRSLRSDDIPMEPRAHRFVDVLLGERSGPRRENSRTSALYLPLTVQGNSIGLLILDNLVSQSAIQEEDMGLLKSFAGQIALAVDNSRLFEEVQALSLHDDLTGLPVRRYFLQRFNEELYRAERAGQPLSVGMIDIDYFKSINDTYGHQIGDQVLREVGRVVSATLRKVDFPCRYGGDEVLILLPQVLAPEACRIMSRLSQRLKEIQIPAPFSKAKEVRVTASIGVSSYPADGGTLEELTQKADEALYWIKSHGRDGVASSPAGAAFAPDAAGQAT